MIPFSQLLEEIKFNIFNNRQTLNSIATKNPNVAYQKLNELISFIGARHNIDLKLHFPIPAKIKEVNAYGTENIGIVIDKFRKLFPIEREEIKLKIIEILPGAIVKDAYMYEGKEGLKVEFRGGTMEILPGSMHLWLKIDSQIIILIDWLVQNVYNIDEIKK